MAPRTASTELEGRPADTAASMTPFGRSTAKRRSTMATYTLTGNISYQIRRFVCLKYAWQKSIRQAKISPEVDRTIGNEGDKFKPTSKEPSQGSKLEYISQHIA